MTAAKRAVKRDPKPVRAKPARVKKPARRVTRRVTKAPAKRAAKRAAPVVQPAPPREVPHPVEERRSFVTTVQCDSGLLILGDAHSIDDAWEQKRHASLTGQFFVDFHGPRADELTAQHRTTKQWFTLDDGTVRIPVRGVIEAEQMVSSAKRTLVEMGGNEDTTIKATPIELTLLRAEDATRDANRAGIVPGLQALAVASPRGRVQAEVFVDAEGQPDEIRIRLR